MSRPAASIRKTDALLEIAAVFLEMRSDGTLARGETHRYHVSPVSRRQLGARLDGGDRHRSASSAAPRDLRRGRAAADLPRSAQRHPRRRLHPRRAGRPQRFFRFEFPECRGGAHADQAQSLSSVLELRHRHFGRRRVRPDRAHARHARRGSGMGYVARRTRPPTMPNAPPISSAPSAISSRACSRPAGGGWQPWGRWKSSPSLPRSAPADLAPGG